MLPHPRNQGAKNPFNHDFVEYFGFLCDLCGLLFQDNPKGLEMSFEQKAAKIAKRNRKLSP